MITYASLSRSPAAFRSLHGLTIREFGGLCREWVHADAPARARDPLTCEDPLTRGRASV